MLNIFRSSILFILLLLSLSACVGMRPPINFSPPNIGVSSTKLDAELKSLTVTVARPDEATGMIDPVIAAYAGLWKTALEDAFIRMAIFKDDSPRKVSLVVKILKFNNLINIHHTSARYEIIDRSDGSIIFTTDVSKTGEGPLVLSLDENYMVVDSINRSVQNNIMQFLQILETVDMEKPMFPSNKKID
jgi:hypothetical protein